MTRERAIEILGWMPEAELLPKGVRYDWPTGQLVHEARKREPQIELEIEVEEEPA